MQRFDYSVPAAVIGILLGKMAELNLIYSCQVSGGQWSYLLERPITIGIIVLLLVSLMGGKLVAMLTSSIPISRLLKNHGYNLARVS